MVGICIYAVLGVRLGPQRSTAVYRAHYAYIGGPESSSRYRRHRALRLLPGAEHIRLRHLLASTTRQLVSDLEEDFTKGAKVVADDAY